MFGARYFGERHFGSRYFGRGGVPTPGYYNGTRYFGPRYFGRRYFGSSGDVPFEVTQTNTIGLAGTTALGSATLTFGQDFAMTQVGVLGLAGSVGSSGNVSTAGVDFPFGAPISIGPLAGVVTVAGSLTITAPVAGYGSYFGRRYFGGAYFGPRDFGAPDSWAFAPTAAIGLSGTSGVGGSFGTSISLVQTAMLGLAGTAALTGDLARPEYVFSPSSAALSGTLTLTGLFGFGFEGHARLVPIEADDRRVEILDDIPSILIEADDRIIDCGDDE